MPALYDALWEAGPDFGIANYGLYAVNSMRMEKGYKAWSTELTNELNMLEADMPRFIDFNKDDFVGKAATLAQAAAALKIVYAEVAATDTDARGGEPVLVAIAASAWSPRAPTGTASKSLAFACVPPEFAAPGSVFEVLIQGERRRATRARRARLRSRQFPHEG
jgi:dimethylglycine dehydrogenase